MSSYRLSHRRRGRVPGARAWQSMGRSQAAAAEAVTEIGEDCSRCGGSGVILTCIDDLCRGAGECMHGDGEAPCPVCSPDRTNAAPSSKEGGR